MSQVFYNPEKQIYEVNAPEGKIATYWFFYGCSVPQQFGRLRFKVGLFPARCAENPDNNYPRGSKGLYAYFDKKEEGWQKQQQEQQRDQSGTAGHPKHKHRALSPMKGYSRARMLSSPRKVPGPPTHLSSPRLSEDSDEPMGGHRPQCCCFLAELPHEHNGTCGDHVHRMMVSACLQDDNGLKLLDDSLALD